MSACSFPPPKTGFYLFNCVLSSLNQVSVLYYVTSFNFYLVSLIICLTLDSGLPEESLAMSYNIESELQYTLNVLLGKSLVTRIRRLHFNKVR